MIADGSRVVIRGLRSAAEHNGKEGVCLSFEPMSNRYLVSLHPEITTISVRSENLLPSIAVTIADVQNRGSVNGCVGRVVGADDTTGRYHVSVQGQVLALTPANVVLPRGSRARIIGLQSSAHHNGRLGLITDVDKEAKRYLIQLDDQHSLRVKWDNVWL